MPEKKEPMIGQESRPTAIDYDAPIANFKLRDLYAVISNHFLEKEVAKVEKEHFKGEKEKEHFKPEKEKEHWKPEKEKEHFKPEKEKEHWKPEKEKEYFKPEKELLKPEKEKEFLKPERSKPFDPNLLDEVVTRVVEQVMGRLKSQGVIK
jgi:hypothetical protein